MAFAQEWAKGPPRARSGRLIWPAEALPRPRPEAHKVSSAMPGACGDSKCHMLLAGQRRLCTLPHPQANQGLGVGGSTQSFLPPQGHEHVGEPVGGAKTLHTPPTRDQSWSVGEEAGKYHGLTPSA